MHPAALLNSPLLDDLVDLKNSGVQLYFQITITGMGNKVCGYDKLQRPWKPEPNAPQRRKLRILPQLFHWGSSSAH
jgi:hypothetical protein